MKTSNKLLIGLLVVVLLAMFGFNTVLKSEYKKLDFTDEFFGYNRQTIAPFNVIKIEGSNHNYIEIRPGKEHAFRTKRSQNEENKVTYQTSGDTLIVTILVPKDYVRYQPGDAFRWGKPAAFVVAPTLNGILVSGSAGRLANWQTNDLQVVVRDTAGGLQLEKTTIGNLKATIQTTSLLEINPLNQIHSVNVIAKDNARFTCSFAKIEAINLKTDPYATVELPGQLLSKLK